MKLNRPDRDLILLHAFFAFAAAFTLSAETVPLGWRVLGLVLFYNMLLPYFSRAVKYFGWLELWLFLLPLSLLLLIPDWFLSQVLGVLTFPASAVPFIANLPLYMAGMWVIPLFIIVYLGRRFRGRYTILLTALSAGVIFLVAESTLTGLPLWQAVNVHTYGGAAYYVLVPEILLGVFTLLAFEKTLGKSFALKLGAAAIVMTAYLASLLLSYLLIEKLIFA